MVRRALTVLAMCLVCCLVACSGDQTAPPVVDERENVREAVCHELELFKDDSSYDGDSQETLSHVLARLDFEVRQIALEDEAATAEVAVSHVDVEQAVDEVADTIGEGQTFDELSTLYRSDDAQGYTQQVHDLLLTQIDQTDGLKTDVVSMRASKTDGAWQIDQQSWDELIQLVLG